MKTFALVLALAVSALAARDPDPLQQLDPEAANALTAAPRAPIPAPVRDAAAPRPETRPAVRGSATPLPRTPPRRTDGRQVIAIDIGHTIAQPGAISATGIPEFRFNKRIAELLFARLKDSPHFAPYLINPAGGPITLPDRTRLATEKGAAVFLAIHHDSALDKYLSPWEVEGKTQRYCDDFHGYGVFTSQKNAQAARSLDFARLLGREMAEQGFEFSPHHAEKVPGENRPILDKFNGVYRYDDLIVLKTAPMPAVLLECGVILNRAEEKQLLEPATQERIVTAIVTALEKFREPSPLP